MSSVAYAGMTIKSGKWIVIPSAEDGMLLAFVAAMTFGQRIDAKDAGRICMQIYKFSFEQLRAQVEANRIHIRVSAFQGVLNHNAPKLAAAAIDPATSPYVEDFVAVPQLQGRWIWTLERFDSWASTVAIKHVHLAVCNANTLTFIYR